MSNCSLPENLLFYIMKSEELCSDSDFSIITKDIEYKVSSFVLKNKCRYFFNNANLSSPPIRSTLTISSPFSNEFGLLLKWLHTGDSKSLITQLIKIEQPLQLYAVSKLFDVKPFTNLRNLLLSLHYTIHNFKPQYNISAALCKELIDLQFLLTFLNNVHYWGNEKLVKIFFVMEWLGEKNCHTDEDFIELEQTKEFREVLPALERNRLIPTAYELENIKNYFPKSAKIFYKEGFSS